MIKGFELLAVTVTLSSIAYCAICLWSAAAFSRECKRLAGAGGRDTGQVSVSILKPLKGPDPEMYESFRSHCLQDYEEYEIIFGVSDPADPAIGLVERLEKEFPQRQLRLVLCSEDLGANTKVSNLIQMLRTARYEHLIVNDSDIRVEPDYLRRVTAPLANPEVGLVTCLYRGIANATLGSRLESLGISTDFCAGVQMARRMEGIRFGLGSTLAFRRRDLDAIGGFEALADYLADDYQLGLRFAEKGFKVELSDVVVETFLPRYSISDFLSHQLRWARTIRDSRFWGHVGLGLTFGLPWALLVLLLSGAAPWAWGLLALTAAMRVATAFAAGRWVLQDRQVLSLLYLIPLRDLIALLVWIASFAGDKIHWRGDSFYLKDGKLERIELRDSA